MIQQSAENYRHHTTWKHNQAIYPASSLSLDIKIRPESLTFGTLLRGSRQWKAGLSNKVTYTTVWNNKQHNFSTKVRPLDNSVFTLLNLLRDYEEKEEWLQLDPLIQCKLSLYLYIFWMDIRALQNIQMTQGTNPATTIQRKTSA